MWKFSLQIVRVYCLGVRSTCILVVLQHVGAVVFSSYSTRTATKSRGPTVFFSPASCCPCYQQMYPDCIQPCMRGVASNTSPWKSPLWALDMPLVHLYRNMLAGFIVTCFCMICLVSTTSTGTENYCRSLGGYYFPYTDRKCLFPIVYSVNHLVHLLITTRTSPVGEYNT